MKFCLLIPILLVVGCGSGDKLVSGLNDTNAKRLHAAYRIFVLQHELKAPKDEQELKDYLNNNPAVKRKLKRAGLIGDDFDAIFASERDGQPFKVRYGVDGLGDNPIVFEAEGVEGKRLVAFQSPREVDQAEYDQLWNQEAEVKLQLDTPSLTP